jgi:hypothetical protein
MMVVISSMVGFTFRGGVFSEFKQSLRFGNSVVSASSSSESSMRTAASGAAGVELDAGGVELGAAQEELDAGHGARGEVWTVSVPGLPDVKASIVVDAAGTCTGISDIWRAG